MPRTRRSLLVAWVAAIALTAAPARAEGLDIFPDATRLAALLVLFLVLVPFANALLFRPLLAVLDEREARIGGARAKAAELARQSAALVEQHDAAMREARASANAERMRALERARQTHQTAIRDARQEAEREIAAARGQVVDAVAAARDALAREAEPLAREVAERLLGRSLA
jgi:F-type H+-transporting ATPase subunit b